MGSVILADSPVTDLIADARRGNPLALAALYREHAGSLLRSVTLLLQERADAEDVVHDLFVGLPEALGVMRDRGFPGVVGPGGRSYGPQPYASPPAKG